MRKPLAALAAAPQSASARGLPDRGVPALGLHLDLDEDAWLRLADASASVHGLAVNRYALREVVERATGAGLVADDVAADPDLALAYEVLCLDEEARRAVACAALGESAARDAALVTELEDGLERCLAASHGTDRSNDGGLTLDHFPYTKSRIAGVLDAAYEAQRKHHAFDTMCESVTARLYSEHPGRVGQKWIVRGGEVHGFAPKAVRNGDVVVNMGLRAGSFDAKKAQAIMSDDEWSAALASASTSSPEPSVAEVRKAARDRGISITPFMEESTTSVTISTAIPGDPSAGTEESWEDSKVTTVSAGLEDFRRGQSLNGSHFYVPDTSEMAEPRAFATLVRARVRADMRRNEAAEIVSALHGVLRRVEAIAINQRLRFEDSKRDFVFHVNRKRSFNKDAALDLYPELRDDVRLARPEGKTSAKPTQASVKQALVNSRGDEGAIAAIARMRDSGTPAPRVSVASDATGRIVSTEPSRLGRASARSRMARGEALNGRVLTEFLDA